MSTRTEKQPPAPSYRIVCQCEHCRELAHVSAGLWAAYGMPRPHTREAGELIAAARAGVGLAGRRAVPVAPLDEDHGLTGPGGGRRGRGT